MEKQIFFLLIIAGFLGGLSLLSKHIDAKVNALSPLTDILNTKMVKSLLSALLFVISIAGFIFYGEQVPFWGDLFPLLCSIIVSFTLAYEVFRSAHPAANMSRVETIFNNIFVNHRTALGTIQVILIIVHFFAESVILL